MNEREPKIIIVGCGDHHISGGIVEALRHNDLDVEILVADRDIPLDVTHLECRDIFYDLRKERENIAELIDRVKACHSVKAFEVKRKPRRSGQKTNQWKYLKNKRGK